MGFRFTPDCSVVICTHNRPAQLSQCIEAVSKLDYPRFEVLVVDSAPVDDTARQIAARWNARYIVEPLIGISRARNRGAQACTTQVVAFLDDEAVPEPYWLAGLAREFEDPGVMAVGGRIIGLKVETRAERFLDGVGGFDCGLDRRVVDRDTPYWFEMSNFGGLGDGGNMAFRRDGFGLWRGFHQNFGKGTQLMFAEEHHALFSLIALGHRVVYTPYAVVRHPYPQTAEELYAFQVRRLTAAAGYLTMMMVEEPSYRWATLKYAIEGAWGKPRKWRAQIPMSPFRILTFRSRLVACLSGPLLYLASRLSRTVAVSPGEESAETLKSRPNPPALRGRANRS